MEVIASHHRLCFKRRGHHPLSGTPKSWHASVPLIEAPGEPQQWSLCQPLVRGPTGVCNFHRRIALAISQYGKYIVRVSQLSANFNFNFTNGVTSENQAYMDRGVTSLTQSHFSQAYTCLLVLTPQKHSSPR